MPIFDITDMAAFINDVDDVTDAGLVDGDGTSEEIVPENLEAVIQVYLILWESFALKIHHYASGGAKGTMKAPRYDFEEEQFQTDGNDRGEGGCVGPRWFSIGLPDNHLEGALALQVIGAGEHDPNDEKMVKLWEYICHLVDIMELVKQDIESAVGASFGEPIAYREYVNGDGDHAMAMVEENAAYTAWIRGFYDRAAYDMRNVNAKL